MPSTSAATVRDFAPSDYETLVAIERRCWPEYGSTVEEARHSDDSWDHTLYFRRRIVAERDGRVVGVARINHSQWSFVPHKMWLSIDVDPDERRRGVGGLLNDALERIAREQQVTRLDAEASEKVPEGVRFLEKRGYAEMKRNWESRLDIASFDASRFADAPARAAAAGHRIVTLADEVGRDGDEKLRRAYELDMDVTRDVPMIDPFTPMPYEVWKKDGVDAPSALPDAWFIAVDPDGRYVGVSNLFASLDDTTFLWQGLTGVRREARGKGIAMALKLKTVEYARTHGKREIKTWNDQRNRPMLRINEAMGFVKQPAWIEFEKTLVAEGAERPAASPD